MKNWVLEVILCLSIQVHTDSQVIWKPWGKENQIKFHEKQNQTNPTSQKKKKKKKKKKTPI